MPISGAVSGMDTASIINQLMQIEALPQKRLASRISTQERQVNALQTLNSKLASIAGKATELAKLASWSPVKASSSSEHVTVTADAKTPPANLSITVAQAATTTRNIYATTGTLDAPVLTPDPSPGVSEFVIIHDDGTRVELDIGDGTLQTIADKLNAEGTGLKAALVKTGGEGEAATYQLHVTSTATGSSSGFKIVPPDDETDTTSFLGGDTYNGPADGQDASITVNGQTLTSSSNTFTDLMPGVDVTIKAGAPASVDSPITADITVSRDAKSLSDSVKAMVDAVNAALTDIDSLTDYNAASNSGGILSGDSTLRSIRNELLSSITAGVGGQSFASVGIEVSREGKVTFDSAKFTEAYNADPTGTAAKFAGTLTASLSDPGAGTVELNGSTWRTAPGTYRISAGTGTPTINGSEATVNGSLLTGAKGTAVEGLTVKYTGQVEGTITFTQGLAAKLEALAQRASNSTTGTVTSAIQSRNDRIDRLESDVASWDTRLELRRTALERQFSAMEVALGQLQNQGSWLASQIAGLPSYSNGS